MTISSNGTALLRREETVGVATRILIVSDERLLADAVQALLSRERDMQVVANMRCVDDVAARAAAVKPDLIIIDCRPDGRSAVHVARAIWRTGSDAAVVFLAGHQTDTVLLAAVEVGASAIVYEERPAAEMIAAVRAIAHGATAISAVTIARMIRLRRSTTDPHQQLTDRERDVLALLAKGTGSRAMAAIIGVSYFTVRTHLRNLASKLAAHSKLEVLAKARQMDLIADWPAPMVTIADDVEEAVVSEPARHSSTDYAFVISSAETRDVCA